MLLIGGSSTEAFDFLFVLLSHCTLCSVLLYTAGTAMNVKFGLSVVNNSYPFLQLSFICFSLFLTSA